MTKQNLQRIEATLEYLSTTGNQEAQGPSPIAAPTQRASRATPSFEISTSQKRAPRSLQFFSARASRPQPSSTPQSAPTRPSPSTVQPFPAQQICPSPVLPKLKLPRFSSHRHSFNTALPMTLLKEIEAVVADWQTQLQETLLQVQKLYAEGPIVDGWLDADDPSSTEGDATTLRNAEVEQLMDYVAEVCETSPQRSPRASSDGEAARRYRLCGLDTDGRLWSRPCPPDQLASVSMAIARYRKLRILLNHKQQLEIRLRQAAEALMDAQAHLQKMFAHE